MVFNFESVFEDLAFLLVLIHFLNMSRLLIYMRLINIPTMSLRINASFGQAT